MKNSHASIHPKTACIRSLFMFCKLGVAADRGDGRYFRRFFCRRQRCQNHNQETNNRPGYQAADTELKHGDFRKAVPADGLQQETGAPCYDLTSNQTDGDAFHALPQPLPDHKMLYLTLIRAQTAQKAVKLDPFQNIRVEAGGNHHRSRDQHQQNQECRHNIERLHGAVFALSHQAKQSCILRHLAVREAIGVPDFPYSGTDIDSGLELNAKSRSVYGIFIRNLPKSVLIHYHAIHVRFEQAAHIPQHPGHMVSL